MKERETLEQSKVTSNKLREMAGEYDQARTEEDKINCDITTLRFIHATYRHESVRKMYKQIYEAHKQAGE